MTAPQDFAPAADQGVGDPLPSGCQVIEVHVGELNQLFNAMDPAPFRERDLDPNAEAYIVDWARDLHHDRPFALLVHLDRRPSAEDVAVLKAAVCEFFKQRALSTRRKLRQLFKVGRRSLVIGLVVAAASVLVGDLVAAALRESRFGAVLRESLLIGGWVAMWRPIEIFLYEWWPIQAAARLYDRLSEMPVRIEPARPKAPDTALPS